MGNNNNNTEGFFSRLKQGLSKTRKGFVKNVDEMIFGEKVVSRNLFEDLEEVLIMADLGPAFTYDLIEEMKYRAKRKELESPEALKQILKEYIITILEKSEQPLEIPRDGIFTIMVLGVNGTGKTTTIGKMAHQYIRNGIPTMLVAADTFRAAAIEQLEIWSKRVNAPLIKQKMGADPSAVVFDALHAATSRKSNAMIIDTAGRLHTKVNLMEELKKIKRIMGRELEGAPHETLLVVDATTGQNALSQAKMFHEEIGITGLVLTKLDGTAKGGIVIRIAKEMNIPIRYIGIGEGLDDLRVFKSEDYVNALFD
ncbi:MAG: signal recognition particle-docking protein FtsY [Deltaproteobacteria bacterium]|nr:signal recognition particle-docking protein FtsY [Deltaproteobacteria bacterium]